MTTAGIESMTTKSPPTLLTETVGMKILMAVSGVISFGFVVVHLIGNLQIFIGPEQLNAYAETLQGLGAVKWGFRLFIAIFFLLHIWKGLELWLENNKARPDSYAKLTSQKSTFASRTMIYTGAMIFFFVVYHLLHFTILPEHPVGNLDVYGMIVTGFQQPLIAGIYILAMLLLAFHLSHAISSMFQTFGLNKPNVEPKLKALANLVAILIFLGYISIPVSILTGFVTQAGGGH